MFKENQLFTFSLFSSKVSPAILARGSSAVEAYNKALTKGKTSVKRVPIMLIGQDRAGKTSLKKSLKGIYFDPEEDSTVGIEVDPSHCKVSIETWKTGATENGQNSDVALSFDYHTARWIVDRFEEESKNNLFETSTEEIENNLDSEKTEMPRQPSTTEPPRELDAGHFHGSSSRDLTVSTEVAYISSSPKEENREDIHHSTKGVPEEVAAVTATLLQGDRKDTGEEIYSTVWDFAGQSVYYVTHPLFLTARAIYCLVYDLSLNPQATAAPLVKQGVYKKYQESLNLKTNLDYLDFWMRSVASLAKCHVEENNVIPKSEELPTKLPPIFLVCTHADKPFADRNPRELAYEILGCLRDRSYGAHLVDVFFVDNTKAGTESECSEVVRLRQKVLTVARELPHINEAIPIKWLKFTKTINALREKGNKCISLKDANDIASNVCNINQDKELKTLMDYLHDLRSLIHFDESPELNKLVVSDPQWLIDVFKKVITVQPAYQCIEKKFIELWWKLEREGLLDEELLTHMWEPLFDNRETFQSLIAIMEKFSLLCSWPSDSSGNKSYLVPSMLRSHPPDEIAELVDSASIPSLFLKFENGHVPPGLFPRLVLQFFQWGEENFWRPEKSIFFHNFARFFPSDDGEVSVILLCHPSFIEIVVHRANVDDEISEDFSSRMALSADLQCDATRVTCAAVVRRQLGLMLECMRNDLCWLRNMTYEMCVICSVCCNGGAVNYCHTHHQQRCREEQCLHFWPVSELCRDKKNAICTRSASAKSTRVPVMQFLHWFTPSEKDQVNFYFTTIK